MKKIKIWALIIATVIFTLVLPFFISIIDIFLSTGTEMAGFEDITYFEAVRKCFTEQQCLLFFVTFEACFLMIIVYFLFNTKTSSMRSDVYQVTPQIKIPVRTGEQQYGNAWFLTQSEYKKAFNEHEIDLKRDRIIKELITLGKRDFKEIEKGKIPDLEHIKKLIGNTRIFSKSGVVIGRTIKKNKELLYTIDHDSHLLCLGSTRCGKTRCVVLQTIAALALSGESMFISDVKGELFDYGCIFLKRLGYKVFVLDFKNPEKSNKFNLLQPIIDAVKRGNMDDAEEKTNDLVSMLVPDNPKTEPIWINGERSIIKMAILTVVIENMDHPEYQNLYNVYRFINEMNKNVVQLNPVTNRQNSVKKLEIFMKELEAVNPLHKAVLAYATAQTAAESPKTLGSFLTSAVSTLEIFASGKINAMTNESDFEIRDLNDEKTALFIILPDQKKTYYKVVTSFISMFYDELIQIADKQGGRLNRRLRFVLDEFGNFTPINNFTNMQTAGGSRGILFVIFLQDFAQVDEKYTHETSKIVRSNCETWIYLRSDDPETLKIISDRLGTYTCSVFNSSSSAGNRSYNRSESANKMSRPLLYPSEVGQIVRPYSLIIGREKPAVITAPDLTEWSFNAMFGLGDEEHNTKVRKYRGMARKERDISGEIHAWNIWKSYDNNNMNIKCNTYLQEREDFNALKYRTDEDYRYKLDNDTV